MNNPSGKQLYLPNEKPINAAEAIVLSGIGSFELTQKLPRCNKASSQFINSMMRKGGILLERKTVHTYTKSDTSTPSTLFSFENNWSGYGNLADIYQKLILEVYRSMYQQLHIGKSFGDMSIKTKKEMIEKINTKGNGLIQYIELKNGFITIVLTENSPALEEGVTYTLYTTDELTNTNQSFPTRIWKQEHLDKMFYTAKEQLSF